MIYDLICLGNITLDDIILPDGQTQNNCFGGDALYATLSGRIWSKHVSFVAPIGNDTPELFFSQLNNSGIDLLGMPSRNLPMIRNIVKYHAAGERQWTLLSDPDLFFPLSPVPSDIPISYLSSKAFLILAMDMKAQEILVPFLKNSGALIALDPQEDYILGNEQRLLNVLKDVDIFMPNQDEVYNLLKHRDWHKAAKELANYGPKIIVIKCGADGSLIFDANLNTTMTIPAFDTQAKDTTGAGDSYCGGFMTVFTEGHNLIRAGIAGTVSASFAIEGYGHSHMFNINPTEAQQRFTKLINLYNHN